jgi:hypothetical protein
MTPKRPRTPDLPPAPKKPAVEQVVRRLEFQEPL